MNIASYDMLDVLYNDIKKTRDNWKERKTNERKKSHAVWVYHLKTLRAVVKLVTCVGSSTIEKNLLNFFDVDSIGVNASPKCVDCQCGGLEKNQCP